MEKTVQFYVFREEGKNISEPFGFLEDSIKQAKKTKGLYPTSRVLVLQEVVEIEPIADPFVVTPISTYRKRVPEAHPEPDVRHMINEEV